MRKRTHEEFIKQMKVINDNIEILSAKERFIQRQINDTIKTQYCNKHNIKLIRIPYTEYNEVENILDKILF